MAAPLQTIDTRAYRDKYRMAKFDYLLRNAVVAEKICEVDRSESKRIQNPYGSQATATVQAIAGTYTIKNYQLNDDTLTVADEIVVGEHIFDFESMLTNFDLFSSRTDEQLYAVTKDVDKFVLNVLCEDGTGSYTTPAGGFTTAANIITIMGNLLSKVSGYADTYKGLYLVIEDTDLPGFIAAQAGNGFSMSDKALSNGFIGRYMNTDIYVVRSGTFTNDTMGSRSDFTNSGHRLFGVKNTTTYATPRGVKFLEKEVSGKTGKEVATVALVGAKVWASKSSLTIDITLA